MNRVAPRRSRAAAKAAATARLAALAATGAVASLAHPPGDVALLTVPAAAAALVLLRRSQSLAESLFGGLAFGAGLFGVLLSWSSRFGLVAHIGLAASQAMFLAPVGVVAARGEPGWRWAAKSTAVWTVAEAARARWPLGGFEWGQFGYAWHDTPARGVASMVGALGLTALTVAAAAAVATAIDTKRVAARPSLALLMAAIGFLALGSRDWTWPAGGLDVAVVQIAPVCTGPAVRCPAEDQRVLEAFVDVTRASRAGADLLVWGEGALGGTTIERSGGRVAAAAVTRAHLLAGVTAPAGAGRFVNANVLYAPDGSVLARYYKRHPVPFGEFVPLRALLGGVAGVGELVPSDLVRGDRAGRLRVGGALVGTVSSFEVSFAREARVTAGNAAVEALIVLTSESSYGRSAVSDQLLAMAQVRAAELGKPVVVAATTGKSAVFAPGGEQLATTPLLSAAVLEERVPLRRGTTPYSRTGDWPVLVAAGLVLLMATRFRLRLPSSPLAARWRAPRTERRVATCDGNAATTTPDSPVGRHRSATVYYGR